MSEQETKACKIFKVMATISGSRVLRAANLFNYESYLTLDWDDQLGDNGKHLCSSLLKHIENTLDSQEAVGVHLLTNALEEDRKIMMIVKLLNLNLPINAELWSMLDGNRKISAVIETAELTWRHRSAVKCASDWLLRSRLFFWLVKADNAAT